MKRILAISGGVDSMVLFDVCLKKFRNEEIVVCHFNHGTRPSADLDEKFVEKKCREKNVKFVSKKEVLGEGVSEELARKRRYEFFDEVLEENKAEKIFTAHHLDDLVESVAINFLRGTGWRGLAVMGNKKIERPLVSWTKKDILKYAAENEIAFREDPTNSDEKYLRNKIRASVRNLDARTKKEIFDLREKQIEIEKEIEKILMEVFSGKNEFQRKMFSDLDEKVAVEVLYFLLERAEISATRPQILNFLQAIKTYSPRKKFNLPKDKLVEIKKESFVL